MKQIKLIDGADQKEVEYKLNELYAEEDQHEDRKIVAVKIIAQKPRMIAQVIYAIQEVKHGN